MGPNDFQDSRDTNTRLPGGFAAPATAGPQGDAALRTRLKARLLAGRLDREVEVGIVPLPGSSLAAHIARLTSSGEREALAGTLMQALAELRRDRRGFSPHIPVDPERLASCRDVIDDITLLLHSPRPVRARGMARLRLLLADGTGPLYRNGRGSLAAELRGVLAAL
ncbi:hypothetical protein [Mycolicibacterium sarraceniae]|uniref:Uncharacterized protein n=1 Tax=Mycolicibacterium sarraceniae TaxID=1534348 RepID=A0A7I7SX53_9MYCO|nr:hypothetical protein [Mycolicibacterium sarraceniae]BBY60789.1 hypothetical protein MSAR_39250 [Mycolicibacterium sarraceniae]